MTMYTDTLPDNGQHHTQDSNPRVWTCLVLIFLIAWRISYGSVLAFRWGKETSNKGSIIICLTHLSRVFGDRLFIQTNYDH